MFFFLLLAAAAAAAGGGQPTVLPAKVRPPNRKPPSIKGSLVLDPGNPEDVDSQAYLDWWMERYDLVLFEMKCDKFTWGFCVDDLIQDVVATDDTVKIDDYLAKLLGWIMTVMGSGLGFDVFKHACFQVWIPLPRLNFAGVPTSAIQYTVEGQGGSGIFLDGVPRPSTLPQAPWYPQEPPEGYEYAWVDKETSRWHSSDSAKAGSQGVNEWTVVFPQLRDPLGQEMMAVGMTTTDIRTLLRKNKITLDKLKSGSCKKSDIDTDLRLRNNATKYYR